MDDLYAMALAWLATEGDAGYNAAADLSLDGQIDNVDSDILAANWQTTGSRGPQHYYYHYDGLGNVVGLSDSAGDTVEKYSYDVYGAFVMLDADGNIKAVSLVGNPYFFTGRRFDSETGLYYYRARFYSPEIGRFLQTDPIGYQAGMNLYFYVGNNPLNLRDPSGCAGMTGLFWPASSPSNPLNHPRAWEPLAIDWEGSKVELAKDVIIAIDAYEAALPYVKGAGIISGGLALGGAALVATPTTTGGALLGYAGLTGGGTAVAGGTAKIMFTAAGDREAAAHMPTSMPGMIGMGFAGDKGTAVGDLIGTALTPDFSSKLSALQTGLSLLDNSMQIYNEFSVRGEK